MANFTIKGTEFLDSTFSSSQLHNKQQDEGKLKEIQLEDKTSTWPQIYKISIKYFT